MHSSNINTDGSDPAKYSDLSETEKQLLWDQIGNELIQLDEILTGAKNEPLQDTQILEFDQLKEAG